MAGGKMFVGARRVGKGKLVLDLKKSRASARRGNSTIVKNPTYPAGSSFRTKLQYSDSSPQVLNTGAGGTFQSQVWNMNSVFDPDRTGVGHQPMGFDQISLFFLRYRVHNFHWSIRVMGLNGFNCHVGICPLNSATLPTSISQIIEHGKSRKTIISTYESELLRGRVNLAKFNGRTKSEYDADDKYEALVTASPTEVMPFIMAIEGPQGSTTGLTYQTEIVYDVEFFDPIDLTQS